MRSSLSRLVYSVTVRVRCGGGGAVIQCFYGPSLPLSRLAEAYPIPMGLAAAGWLIASLALIVCWLSRLAALLTWKKRLLKSMAPYLREPPSPADLDILAKDLRCRLFDTLDLWLGEDWVVVPGKAMARDAVVGVFYEQLSRKYLSSKVRIAIIDEEGRRLYADAPGWLHPLAANYLSSIHPQCSDGDIRSYQAFLLREQQAGREVPDHRRLLPAAAFGGAVFLLLADLAARTLVAPIELPIGVVTSLVGAVVFIVIFYKAGKG